MSVAATRFGHTEGRVCLAYNQTNNKIVTVGSDGEMRVWAGQCVISMLSQCHIIVKPES